MSKIASDPNPNSRYRVGVSKVLVFIGNVLTLIGITFLITGLLGLISLDNFAFGLSSGVRMIGMVVIAGCLLSAIGYGFLDYIEE